MLLRTFLAGKIHRAVVTEANLNYNGSITVDHKLLRAAGIHEYEQVDVLDIDNGNRLTTYAISAPEGSGVICLNGAAARLVHPGDRVIILSYCALSEEEISRHRPKIVLVDEDNQIQQVIEE